MKKILLILSIIAIALSACAKKEESSTTPSVSVTPIQTHILSQFEYNASDNVRVQVVEFENDFHQQCISVHANYIYQDSSASVICIPHNQTKFVRKQNTEIVKQFVYKAGTNSVQVTNLTTKNNNRCTIVHANYELPKSTATISCY